MNSKVRISYYRPLEFWNKGNMRGESVCKAKSATWLRQT